jgi:hypothetical protein
VDAGLPPNALLFTSLRAAWPMVLLNVSLGDQAVLERRPCGCPLGEAGWQTHVHDVRSFDKLKIEPLRDPAAVIRLVEEILPRRFGGTPADFQLVDDETHVAMGQAPVRLLVHPRVGPVETHEVMALLLELDWGPGTTVNAAWRDRNWVTVERRAPYRSAGGKIYHVHQLTGHGLGTDSPRAAERER